MDARHARDVAGERIHDQVEVHRLLVSPLVASVGIAGIVQLPIGICGICIRRVSICLIES
jgi:hypothetical protein